MFQLIWVYTYTLDYKAIIFCGTKDRSHRILGTVVNYRLMSRSSSAYEVGSSFILWEEQSSFPHEEDGFYTCHSWPSSSALNHASHIKCPLPLETWSLRGRVRSFSVPRNSLASSCPLVMSLQVQQDHVSPLQNYADPSCCWVFARKVTALPPAIKRW